MEGAGQERVIPCTCWLGNAVLDSDAPIYQPEDVAALTMLVT
jgi:hypothetical protein